MTEEVQPLSLSQQIKRLPANFWVAILMEMFERLAFFGVRAIAPLFLVASINENGLGLTYTEKGIIYTVWALFQCLVPMVSGGYTDHYGYRKSLVVAFFLNIAGYITMAMSTGFWSFMLAALLVANGTAIFKPPTHGTIAASTDEKNSSVGWGLFYWIVNVGGALAPFLAAQLRGETNWRLVFYGAAVVTACNFIPALFLYREPDREKGERKSPVAVFAETLKTLKNVRFLLFLAIFSGFWLMFMQLWDTLPNFIDEWVNTRDVAPWFLKIPWVGDGMVLESGHVKPEMIINIDAVSIILFMIPIAWLTGKINPMTSIILGMIISVVGFIGTGGTNIGYVAAGMVFLFSLGEMACSPKFSEYVGLIAPPGKKALFMGYSNIPFAVGWAFGNLVAGKLYDSLASKINFARMYLVDELGLPAEWVMDDEKLPSDLVMEVMTARMDGVPADQVMSVASVTARQLTELRETSGLSSEEISQRSADATAPLEALTHTTTMDQATQILWDLHNPTLVWWVLGGIGLVATIGMIVFYLIVRRSGGQAISSEGVED